MLIAPLVSIGNPECCCLNCNSNSTIVSDNQNTENNNENNANNINTSASTGSKTVVDAITDARTK